MSDSRYSLRKRKKVLSEPTEERRGGPRPHAGAKQGSKQHRTVNTEAHRRLSDAAHAPEAVKKRVAFLQTNAKENADLQLAMEYKEAHGVGERPVQKVVERIVYLKAERRKPRHHFVAPIDHLVSRPERHALRQWIYKHSLNKNGNMVLSEIAEGLNKDLKKNLGVEEWRTVLHTLNIHWGRVKQGYYRAMHFAPKLVKRRTMLAPLLDELYKNEQIIVWNYDQTRPHVNDMDKYGWIDYSVDFHSRPRHMGTERQRGASISIGGFICKEFGLLYRDDGTHVGCAMTESTSKSSDIAAEFEEAAELISQRWPQYLHVIFTDSPNVHAGMDPGFCNPNGINKKDGGKNRGRDNLFQSLGLTSIFARHFLHLDVSNMDVPTLRRLLWRQEVIREQSFHLETVCGAQA